MLRVGFNNSLQSVFALVEDKKKQLLEARMQVEEGVKAKKRKSVEPSSPERTQAAGDPAHVGGTPATPAPLPSGAPLGPTIALPGAADANGQAIFPSTDVQMDSKTEAPPAPPTPPPQPQDLVQERAAEAKREATERIRQIREAAVAADANAAARAAAASASAGNNNGIHATA